MAQPQLQDLLEAGVHFGHQTRRWNPKMRRFIFAERSGIYIIDLQKTLRQIQKAQELLRSVVLKGESVLFVCTKKQLKALVQAEAAELRRILCHRALAGRHADQLRDDQEADPAVAGAGARRADGDFENYTKKEKLLFERERVKLCRNLEGMKHMGRLPGALFIVDAKKEKIAMPKPTSSASRWWRSWTPTPTPTSSPCRSPATTTPSARSPSSPRPWPT